MNPKLLIVDDDEEIRTQMKWALAKDYEILLAEDRASAVETYRSARPTVVLLDLGLPPQPGNPEEGLAPASLKSRWRSGPLGLGLLISYVNPSIRRNSRSC